MRPLDAFLVLLAMLATSSGGLWFALMFDAPPVRKASWRLFFTACIQVPFCVHQYFRANADLRGKVLHALPRLATSGVFLGLHFGTWSWGVSNTSLTHSLLFVSTTPLLIILQKVGMAVWARWGPHSDNSRPMPLQEDTELEEEGSAGKMDDASHTASLSSFPTPLEMLGTLLGFTSAALLILLGSHKPNKYTQGVPVSWTGDLASFLGALCILVYLDIGGSLRRWCPTFLYALPVNVCASLCAYVVSVVVMQEDIRRNVWDRPRWILYSLCAAATAGMMGHTIINYVQCRVSSLIISVALLMEPVTGSFLGWLVGVQGVPGWATFVMGGTLMVALLLIILGERKPPLSQTTE